VSVGEPVSVEIAELLNCCALCRRWAEQDEGPYHRESQPVRRDVTEGVDGAALQLGIRLATDADEPLRGAAVEIWQCDALGRYSGFPPPPASGGEDTAVTTPRGEYLADDSFLRGGQFTDAAGMVEFRTIYPGWYPGRTVHIHIRVHATNTILTSQLYFPDPISDEVLATPPYNARPGRDTTNATDEIHATGGAPAVVDVVTCNGGYRAAVCLLVPGAV
jgi:protocatechuate 3,4-dioxygenase beta subunit